MKIPVEPVRPQKVRSGLCRTLIVRFFFDTFDGESWVQDDEGIECADHEAARNTAHAALAALAKDQVPNSDQRVMIVRVRDDDGLLLETSLALQTRSLR